jgi:ribonuclease T2
MLAALASMTFGAPPPETKKKQQSFDYFMLVLSYAPDFCDQPTGNKDPRECGKGRKVGFVVHGLWPQGETKRGPENCGSASPVASGTVQLMLNYFPTESLIQHEWKAHGTCSGLSADNYFAAVRKARDSITIPAQLTPSSRQSMTPAAIEASVASANPSFPQTAFRTSCYQDKELEEIRICLNKDLTPRACGSSAGQCSASAVSLLPVH